MACPGRWLPKAFRKPSTEPQPLAIDRAQTDLKPPHRLKDFSRAKISVPHFPHGPLVEYNRSGIFMQVSKWGNSLAVRLPAVVVKALDLKEGDEIEISIAGKRDFKVGRDRSRERALNQLRQLKWSFPPDFKFDREEINER
jgi:antitoxin MazE